MTRPLAGLLLVSLSAFGCRYEVVHGNGTVRDEERAVPAFSKVEVRAALRTEIVKADEPGVTLQADENLLGLLVARVQNDTLLLAVAEEDVILEPSGPMTAVVATPSLQAVDTSSDEPVSLSAWQSATLTLTSDGAGGLAGSALDVGDLVATLGGSGDVTLDGEADTLRASTKGSGALDASALVAGRVTVELGGDGDVSVHTTGIVDGTLTGGGDLVITGRPSRIDVQDSGGGGVSIR